MQDTSRKASRNINKRYSVEDYEGVCLEVGKFLEKIIKQISISDDRGTLGTLDRLASQKKIRPLIANNLKSAWELRNIAAHDSNYVFSRDNAVISIIAFNEINRWYYSYFQNARFSNVYSEFENSNNPLLSARSSMERTLLKELIAQERAKSEEGNDALPVKTKSFTQYRAEQQAKARVLKSHIFDSSHVEDFDTASDWITSNSEFSAYRDFTSLVINLLENRKLIPKENKNTHQIIDALGSSGPDTSLKRLFMIYFTYCRRVTSTSPPVLDSYRDDIDWLRGVKRGLLIEMLDLLFPRYSRDFMKDVQVKY